MTLGSVSLGGFSDLFVSVVWGGDTLGSVNLGGFSLDVQLRGFVLSGISFSLEGLPKLEV